jgi:8-amino-7-oxononanoate synthase
VGDAAAALALSQQLEAVGLYVPAIRPPTVPQGQARLRVALSALHSESDVERLLDALVSRPASRRRIAPSSTTRATHPGSPLEGAG